MLRLKPSDIGPAIGGLMLSVLLQAMQLHRLHGFFMQPLEGKNRDDFLQAVHLSGYDPNIVLMVSDWDYLYNAVRHPLLAWMVWPLFRLNTGLQQLTGMNLAPYVVAVMLCLSTMLSAVLLNRILHDSLRLKRPDALLLTAWFFSMGYIMLSPIVPDHFTFSLTLLLAVLWMAAQTLYGRQRTSTAKWVVMFVTTAGVTLSNGIKVLMAAAFADGKRFFRLRNLLLTAVVPSLVLFATALWEQHRFVDTRETKLAAERQEKARRADERLSRLTGEKREKELARRARREAFHQRQAEKVGRPMEQEGFLRWTDVSTARVRTAYENLFGESILFHEDHFLEDTLVHRPVFVSYRHWWCYVCEAIVVLLMAAGLAVGLLMKRRSRLLCLAATMFLYDMALHMVLGFGLNEVQIMAPHWLFVVPIATAYCFMNARRPLLWTLRGIVAVLTVALFCHNFTLLLDFS